MKQNEEPEGIKPQMPKRVKRYLRRKSKANLDLIKKMENYCNDCVKWEEANVILGMMGDLFGFSSPPIKAAVARIKNNFNNKLYGKSIKAKTVVMNNYYGEKKAQVEEEEEPWKAVDLKFFDMKKYGSDEKQQKLRKLLKYAANKIDTNNGRDWFCVYAANRYVEESLGTKLEYVEFFSDIELLLPGVLKRIRENETGYKRYKSYSELLRREAEDWYVFDGSLPPINEMVYSRSLGCTEGQFKRISIIIKDLYRQMKAI